MWYSREKGGDGVNEAFYPTELGWLKVCCRDGAVTALRWVDEPEERQNPSPLTDEAARQVGQYLAGERREFELPLAPEGTPFARRVWRVLQEIPYGHSRTYGQLAAQLGVPGGARAVGAAAGRNPVWPAIPCHRCVGKNGALTGYAGGLRRKEQLLALEKSNKE